MIFSDFIFVAKWLLWGLMRVVIISVLTMVLIVLVSVVGEKMGIASRDTIGGWLMGVYILIGFFFIESIMGLKKKSTD